MWSLDLIDLYFVCVEFFVIQNFLIEAHVIQLLSYFV